MTPRPVVAIAGNAGNTRRSLRVEGSVNTKRFFFLAMVALIVGAVSTQTQTQTQNDARALLQAVAKNQGTDSLRTLQYTASGMIAAPGQSYTSMDMGVGVPEHWPRFGVTDYTMTVDFEMMSSKEEYTRTAPKNPTNLYPGLDD